MGGVSERKTLTNGEVLKLVSFIVFAAAAWYRMEYRFDKTTDEMLARLDKHIIQYQYERESLLVQLTELKQGYKDVQLELNELKNREFLRPSGPTIETKRRYR